MNSLLLNFLVVLLAMMIGRTRESPVTESDENIDVITAYNKSVSELMNEQTEAIRKIISAAHNPEEHDSETPKTEEDKNNQKLQEDSSIERLKEKCEQHFKISGNKHNDKFEELGEAEGLVKLIVPLAQPINPQFTHPETTPPLLFSLYADNQVFSNKKTEAQSQDNQQVAQAQNLYLTKLSPPLVSQHPPNFHKDANKPIYPTKIGIPPTYESHATKYENAQTKFKVAAGQDSEHLQDVQTTTATKFTMTGGQSEDSVKTPPNFDYVQLEPVWLQKTVLSDGRIFYYWFRKVSQTPPPAPSETTAYEKLQPQLKFVLPILPASSEVVGKDRWHFEPHGYVKSNFRSPTLHMIRALKVPNMSEKGKEEEVRAKIDERRKCVPCDAISIFTNAYELMHNTLRQIPHKIKTSLHIHEEFAPQLADDGNFHSE